MTSLTKTNTTVTSLPHSQRLASLKNEVDALTREATNASSGGNLSDTAERLQTAYDRVKKELDVLDGEQKRLYSKTQEVLTKSMERLPSDKELEEIRLAGKNPPPIVTVVNNALQALMGSLSANQVLSDLKMQMLTLSMQIVGLRMQSHSQTMSSTSNFMQIAQSFPSVDIDFLAAQLASLEVEEKTEKTEEEEKEPTLSTLEETSVSQENQSSEIPQKLRELQDAIRDNFAANISEDNKKQNIRTIIAAFNPESERNKIYEEIWIHAGRPDGDFNYGSNHVVDDITLLHNIIQDRIIAFYN